MRVAILCAGRGAYTKRSRNSLPEAHPWVVRAEELRREYGLVSLLELDRSKRWESAVHLRPDHVSPLIYLITMLDAEQVREEHEVVCVAGNSMGWYSALAVGGALSFEDGFRLVQEMALLQMEFKDGGQLVYPIVDEHWVRDPKLAERIERVLTDANGEVFDSIRLGGYRVLAGTEQGCEFLSKALPFVEMGPTFYPYRLAQHGPYHTPLLEGVRAKARRQLERLEFRAPATTLVDGRGARSSPWSTDPAELLEYTLGEQITTPFDFTTSIRVALREFAPDQLVLPGPGNTLGGIAGQTLALEGWRGIRTREQFEAAQADDHPPVWSMRR